MSSLGFLLFRKQPHLPLWDDTSQLSVRRKLVLLKRGGFFPKYGWKTNMKNHHLEEVPLGCMWGSHWHQNHGLHHGPIKQQRKLWIKHENVWWTIRMMNQVTSTLEELTKKTSVLCVHLLSPAFRISRWKQKKKTRQNQKKTRVVLQPKSSRLLINDDFPFRLEKVNIVSYWPLPWDLFNGWPRNQWQCLHHLQDHATFVRTPHICQIGFGLWTKTSWRIKKHQVGGGKRSSISSIF